MLSPSYILHHKANIFPDARKDSRYCQGRKLIYKISRCIFLTTIKYTNPQNSSDKSPEQQKNVFNMLGTRENRTACSPFLWRSLFASSVTSTCIPANGRGDLDPWIWAKEHVKKLRSLLVALGSSQSARLHAPSSNIKCTNDTGVVYFPLLRKQSIPKELCS